MEIYRHSFSSGMEGDAIRLALELEALAQRIRAGGDIASGGLIIERAHGQTHLRGDIVLTDGPRA